MLEERDSQLSQDILLDDHIMNEQDSQHVDDEEHIPLHAKNAGSINHYKFKNGDSERPKTSNGNGRPNPSSISEEKVSQLERINQYHKHMEEKKKGASRPLSGGLNNQKIKTESQKSRVSKTNMHNMSMYEKFGNFGLGSSPDRNQQQYINQPKQTFQSGSSSQLTKAQNPPNLPLSSQLQQKLSYLPSQPSSNQMYLKPGSIP